MRLMPLDPADKRWTMASGNLKRVMGIEPTLRAWEAPVLPLNYTRVERRILWDLIHRVTSA